MDWMFVPATAGDVEGLRLLAGKSEAHWGYSETFMETFDREFNITENFIEENPVYVAFRDGKPMAFWGLVQEGDIWELEYFYVSENALGTGIGKQMWKNMIGWCRENNIQEINFVTSPQAVGFYKKMGAVQDRTVNSTIDNRPIPHFLYGV